MTMTDIPSVKNALSLLRVAVNIGSPQIVSTCVAYLEAVPWEKSEEKEILRILPKLGPQAELALARLQPVSALAVANIFLSAIRLATSSPSSLTNDLKSSAQEQLEYMLTEDDGAPLLTVDDEIKLETSRYVNGFLARFVNLVNSFLITGGKNEAIVEKGKSESLLAYLSDLSWVFQIVTKLDISSDFVLMWVETSVNVVRIAESAFPGVQLKVVDVTSKVLETIGSGLVVLPAVKRLGMVKIWLPFVRNVKSLVDLIVPDDDDEEEEEDNDMMIKPDAEMWQSLESAFVSIILTLPSSDQAEILTEWLEDKQICYPNLTEAFEVWCHRSKAAMRRLALMDETNQATNKIRLKRRDEANENTRSYKAQPHIYTNIKVARDEDLKEQIGNDIYFDLVDHDKVRSFLIEKQMTFNLFKEKVAKEFGIPVQYQRFWIWAERNNNTYRPHRPLTQHEEALPVGALREVSEKARNGELKLFLDVKRGQASPEKNKEDILLFFKLYDPIKEELGYVGRLSLKSSGKPIEILTKLNGLAGFAPDQEIELFEEVKFEPTVMCERLDPNDTFSRSQIDDGDIICFQKKLPPERNEQTRFPEVPLFLEYVKNRQNVHFRASENPKEDEFCLELAKNHTYDDVMERVAQHLRLDDPSKIRLTHNCYSQQLEPNPIKYRSVNQISDTLYYEVLDIETLKVAFHHATKDEAIILDIRLPKPSTVGDVLNEIKTKVELSHPDAELRLLEVFYHKIYKIFPLQEKIENINDQYWTLRAEEIPEEEKNLSLNDRLIHVYHFTKESALNQVQVQNFGEPFFLVIHDGETLAEVKARIQKKLQVADEEFSKWKFAFFSLGRPEYLEDSVVVSTRFQRRDVYGVWEQHLGLEHTDTTPKTAFSASKKRHTFEKPVKYTINPIYFIAANEKEVVFDCV